MNPYMPVDKQDADEIPPEKDNEELCANGDNGEPCYLDLHKREFAKVFKEFINEEIKPYNQTK